MVEDVLKLSGFIQKGSPLSLGQCVHHVSIIGYNSYPQTSVVTTCTIHTSTILQIDQEVERVKGVSNLDACPQILQQQ